MSETKIIKEVGNGYGALKFNVRLAAVNALTGKEDQVWEKLGDVGDVQLTQIMQAQILGLTQNNCVKDVTGTLRTVNANSTMTGFQLYAGTGGAAAAVTDYQLGTQAPGNAGAYGPQFSSAVNTTTGAYQVWQTFGVPTISTTYTEISLNVTIGSYTFQIARDYNGSGVTCSTIQYLAATYTITPS